MFESYLISIISTHFGHLFTNLSKDNMSVSAWRGEVVLRDLGIRREALQVLLGDTAASGSSSNADGISNDGDAGDADRDEDGRSYHDDIDCALDLDGGGGGGGSNGDDVTIGADTTDDDSDSSVGGGSSARSKCPLQIEHGTIGTFELRIPWSVLRQKSNNSTATTEEKARVLSALDSSDRNEAEEEEQQQLSGCSVILTDVNILVTPTLDNHRRTDRQRRGQRQSWSRKVCRDRTAQKKNDDDEERRRQFRERREMTVQQLLQETLLRRTVANSAASKDGKGTPIAASNKSEKSGEGGGNGMPSSWVGSLTSSILSSLTVTVRNVHIRYEDPGTIPAFGTLSSSVLFESRSRERLKRTRSLGHPSIRRLPSLEKSEYLILPEQQRRPFAIGLELRSFLFKNAAAAPPKERELFEVDEGVADPTVEVSEVVPENLLAHSARHKLATATDLSMYWDSNANLMYSSSEERRRIHSKRPSSWDGNTSARHASCGVEDSKADVRHYAAMFASLSSVGVKDGASELCGFVPLPHTYVVKPMSASLHFSIITPGSVESKAPVCDDADRTSHAPSAEYVETRSQIASLPPSRAVLTIPSCNIALTRSTLEDVAYIRHSISAWQQINSGLLSESLFLRMKKIRPNKSVKDDPKAWWIYASEAVRLISGLETHTGRSRQARDISTCVPRNRRRAKGWRGLVQALAFRRKYTNLYGIFLSTGTTQKDREQCHTDILNLEDELSTEEIVAFRMYLPAVLGEVTLRIKTESAILSREGGKSREATDCNEGGGALVSWQSRKESYEGMIITIEEVGCLLQSDEVDIFDQDNFMNERSKECLVGGSRFEVAILLPELSVEAIDVMSSSSGCQLCPIARLACTLVQRCRIFRDGSWEASCVVAGLEAIDLMTLSSDETTGNFRLLGEKRVIERHVPSSTFTTAAEDGERTSLNDGPAKLKIGSISRKYSASIALRKTVDASSQQDDETSTGFVPSRGTTYIDVQLSPLEIIYSTNVTQALTVFFDTAKTPELAQDYQRMAAVVSNWQLRQRERILQELSEKDRKVVANIDVSAPVLIVPEHLRCDEDCPALVIDLGRLTLIDSKSTYDDYDDSWELSIADIQVLCFSSLKANRSGLSLGHPLVEPFCLDFDISTRFGSNDVDAAAKSTSVGIKAILPRLAFNFTSSAVRLVSRLNGQWKRIEEKRAHMFSFREGGKTANPLVSVSGRSYMNIHRKAAEREGPQNTFGESKVNSRSEGMSLTQIKFDFSAPFVALTLGNDADNDSTVPLIYLVVRGISGCHQIHSIESTTSKTILSARLKSLHAVDLYQRAGIDYSLLLSSEHSDPFYVKYPKDFVVGRQHLSPGIILDQWLDSFYSQRGANLVTLSYEDERIADAVSVRENDLRGGSKMLIGFNELFVEWNPETIAAVQIAMRLPMSERIALTRTRRTDEQPDECPNTPTRSIDDGNDSTMSDYFDAIEDEGDIDHFHDAPANSSNRDDPKDNALHFFTLPTDTTGSISPLKASAYLTEANVIDSPTFATPKTTHEADPLLNSPLLLSEIFGEEDRKAAVPPQPVTKKDARPFEFVFKLSKLRVRFNKESRYRRLVTAEMDRTYISYSSKPGGGVSANASVGNLNLIDPASALGETLYSRILGLKSDVQGTTSLWKMIYETFPRQNESDDEFLSASQSADGNLGRAVIDGESGTVIGCDSYVELTFSPMRFVYLQQLWLEITDYFFEGILGNEVWGRVILPEEPLINQAIGENRTIRPPADQFAGAGAAGLSFLKFVIKMESPDIILPVSYRSPQHMRLSLNSMACANRFSGRLEEDRDDLNEETGEVISVKRMQWYNNCDVLFEDLSLSDWEGTPLIIDEGGSRAGNVSMRIHVKWPIGLLAPSIIPKWSVICAMDPIQFRLRRLDYALFQHFLSYNIGEESRHLDEWNALQNLCSDELRLYKESIAVNFGYDRKDGPHTSYHLQIQCESFIIHLATGRDVETGVGRIECSSLQWSMKKLSDRITRQRLTCGGITLEQTSGDRKYQGFRHLLLPLLDGDNNAAVSPRKSELVYESTSRPNGDNVKSLWIHDACIYLIYGAFMRIKDFFSGLPDPDVMSQDEIASSMQIGDRWYRIGGNSSDDVNSSDVSSLLKGSQSRVSEESNLYKPLYQFRLVLVSPHIVLVSDPAMASCQAMTLRLSHLDYFYENDQVAFRISRGFFVDGMELYTGNASEPTNVGNFSSRHSLLHPLCVGAISRETTSPNAEKTELNVFSDTVRARAAYTDMGKVVDAILSLSSDMVTGSGSTSAEVSLMSNEEDACCGLEGNTSDPLVSNESEAKQIAGMDFSLSCAGFDLLVIDDSMRHFATAQKLIQISLGEMKFVRFHDCEEIIEYSETFGAGPIVASSFWLGSLNVEDHLQPRSSRFRWAARTYPGTATRNFLSESVVLCSNQSYKMTWNTHSTVNDNVWGYRISPTLLRQSADLAGNSSAIRTRRTAISKSEWLIFTQISSFDLNRIWCETQSLEVQWNPSTIIALQRFLGRFKKATKVKKAALSQVMSRKSMVSLTSGSGEEVASSPSKREMKAYPSQGLAVELSLEEVSLCLNKEHQNRRLVEAAVSRAKILVLRDSAGSTDIQGSVENISAVDVDHVWPICDSNRKILSILRQEPTNEEASSSSIGEFISFHYRNFAQTGEAESFSGFDFLSGDTSPLFWSDLPGWVLSSIHKYPLDVDVNGSTDTMSFVSVRVASLQFVHIKERTEEIIDYLSNGLPGKGMGLSSKYTKEVIKKRLKSYLQVHVASPHVFAPRDFQSEQGLAFRLGQLGIKSWFQEKTAKEVEAKECNETESEINEYGNSQVASTDTVDQATDWYRILSLQVSGLGGRIIGNRSLTETRDQQATSQINLQLTAWMPTWHSNAIVLRGGLSRVEYALKYTDYLFINEVLDNNLGKSVDTSVWDSVNVEGIFWDDDDGPGKNHMESNPEDKTIPIRYASDNARLIHYGRKAKGSATDVSDESEVPKDGLGREASESTTLDIKFVLDGAVLMLVRDDTCLSEVDATVGLCRKSYEIIRLIVKRVEIASLTQSGGRKSLHLSLYRIGLYDMGEGGRLDRDRFNASHSMTQGSTNTNSNHLRKASAFSVLAEGYQPSRNDQHCGHSESMPSQNDPQVVVSVNIYPSSSSGAPKMLRNASETDPDCTATVARVVINYLSICALMRPLVETAEFLTAKWNVIGYDEGLSRDSGFARSTSPASCEISNKHKGAEKAKNTSEKLEGKGGGGFQLRLVANYPRIFFLADESDPCTRALVLRGLAVVNASKSEEIISHAKVTRSTTSVDANFTSLESYINPNVDGALGPNRHSNQNNQKQTEENIELGIALIEPVTAAFDFCRVDRSLWPTSRTVCLSMEPVSTTLSFEDISLLEIVLRRWSSEKKSSLQSDIDVASQVKEEESGKDHDVHAPSFDVVTQDYDEAPSNDSSISNTSNTSMGRGGTQRSVIVDISPTQEPAYDTEKVEFDVVFPHKRLGIGLRKAANGIAVDSVQAKDLVTILLPGDRLQKVGSTSLGGVQFASAIQILSSCPRPMTIRFQREIMLPRPLPPSAPTLSPNTGNYSLPSGEHIIASSESREEPRDLVDASDEGAKNGENPIDNALKIAAAPYKITFSGKRPNGISLEKSSCGDLAVVSRVDPAAYYDAIEANSKDVHIPTPGAIVLAWNGSSSLDIGYIEVENLMTQVNAPAPALAKKDETTAVQIQGEGSDSVAKMHQNTLSYTITFLEAETECWPSVDYFHVDVAGFRLTLIDDINGRDMPVLRASLNKLRSCVQKGLHLHTSAIATSPPLLLSLPSDDSSVPQHRHQVSDLSETINRVHCQAEMGLEYYNARIAFWEPFLEPQVFRILFEQQEGNGDLRTPRSGVSSLEISDGSLAVKDLPKSMQFSKFSPSIASINITDASAEMILRALYEWKEWRKQSPILRQNFEREVPDEDSLDLKTKFVTNTRTPQSPSRDRETHSESASGSAAAQDAANAALIFAQKRGANASQQKSDSAKPFVLRNKSGIRIAFVQQSDKRGANPSRRSLASNFQSTNHDGAVETCDQFCFNGMGEYRSSSVQYVNEDDEARFSMDNLTDYTEGNDSESTAQLSSESSKRYRREYDGRFPRLMVSFASTDEFILDPVFDLSVVKIGKSLRRLRVRRARARKGLDDQRDAQYILVLWNVELQNNRRVLTISSAVSIGSIGCGVSIEVGIKQHFRPAEHNVMEGRDSASVRRIGFATASEPFFLPLWLDLQFTTASVFVRPASTLTSGEEIYSWCSSSILDFEHGPGKGSREIIWSWKNHAPRGVVMCEPQCLSGPDIFSAFLSFSCERTMNQPTLGERVATDNSGSIEEKRRDRGLESISVVIGATLSLRNMLPVPIEWEVSYSTDTPSSIRGEDSVHSERLDGSFLRKSQHRRCGSVLFSAYKDGLNHDEECQMQSGSGVELFSCNASSTREVQLRFKCSSVIDEWSEWAVINPLQRNYGRASKPTRQSVSSDGVRKDQEQQSDINKTKSNAHNAPEALKVNVQTTGAIGPPVTFGMRIIPKESIGTTVIDEITDQHHHALAGFDVVVFAELWIRNLAPLPLVFGAPSSQIYKPEREEQREEASDDILDSVRKVAAEAALMELTSVLEFGDRGKGLKVSPEDEEGSGGDVHVLPSQQGDVEICEEVFEYLEMDQSEVKRRWWASEGHDKSRPMPTLDKVPGGKRWKWIDERWGIDCAGKTSDEGFESCRNLAGGTTLGFTPLRDYDPGDPFRRRRWYRKRVRTQGERRGEGMVFHQPSTETLKRHRKRPGDETSNASTEQDGDSEDRGGRRVESHNPIQINAKLGDGRWSLPATIPQGGSAHGVLRVFESRWPTVTVNAPTNRFADSGDCPDQSDRSTSGESDLKPTYGIGCLSPAYYEICYSVSPLGGIWGEFSSILTFSPRFFVRNESTKYDMLIKQVGAPDATVIAIKAGETIPFHWADRRLPELVCVRPMLSLKKSSSPDEDGDAGNEQNSYRWSGGFDICRLGMTALRIRKNPHIRSGSMSSAMYLRTIRALVEIRAGTGSTGITLSLREENPSGLGSLFRIENRTPFPIWVAQDGILANPLQHTATQLSPIGAEPPSPVDGPNKDFSGVNGDLTNEMEQVAFGLDVPFRQGKYAHRKAASMEELLRVRVCLAPLHSRDGIESTKVLGLSSVGNFVRLSPYRLVHTLGEDLVTQLLGTRVVGIVCADGPTRVLRFVLMVKEVTATSTIRNVMRQQVASPYQMRLGNEAQRITYEAAIKTADLLTNGLIPEEVSSMRQAYFGKGIFGVPIEEARASLIEKLYAAAVTASADNDAEALKYETSKRVTNTEERRNCDQKYSFKIFFKGFTISIVDQVPSEIAVISLRNVVASANWNEERTDDALAVVSVGWLQIDNHCPNAPFPVGLYPDERCRDSEEGEQVPYGDNQVPFLNIGLTFAPRHSSGITCLRSVTIEPRDVAIAVDLAFIMRFQRFLLGIQHHHERCATASISGGTDRGQSRPVDQEFWDFPDLEKIFQSRSGTTDTACSGSEKLYFEGLTVLPCNVRLSVAPSKALTPAQAALEGSEAAAIHAAVRKGDVLLGDGAGVLGVKIGSTNRTAVAVIRGVFKSILVDALLRCDEASMQFSGVSLRNYISTTPQLGTYLGAHYIASLRNNVPALIGSLSFFGNPVGLIRGIGDGVSDFVNEPVKGLKRSVEELDPTFVVDGVARGTGSLARHAVGGIADTASLLTETFSKNMAVLTLDRKYAQRRDKAASLRAADGGTTTLVEGIESGVVKLLRGVVEGVSGVVRAPMRGAEKRGVEGFAKGIGKGLLGLLVKPVIGLSDAATDVMIGVKGSVEGVGGANTIPSARRRDQLRPRRAFYGSDRSIRPYDIADATAAALMMRTRLSSEQYLSHFDMGDRVVLMSVRQALIIGEDGQELLIIKFSQISSVEVRRVPSGTQQLVWGVLIFRKSPHSDGNEIEVILCEDKGTATELAAQLKRGVHLLNEEK